MHRCSLCDEPKLVGKVTFVTLVQDYRLLEQMDGDSESKTKP